MIPQNEKCYSPVFGALQHMRAMIPYLPYQNDHNNSTCLLSSAYIEICFIILFLYTFLALCVTLLVAILNPLLIKK